MKKALTEKLTHILNEECIAHYVRGNKELNDYTIVYVAQVDGPDHSRGDYVAVTDETLLTDLPFGD